jgi:hypothetical protein
VVAGWMIAATLVPDVRMRWAGSLGFTPDGNDLPVLVAASIPALLFGYCLWEAGWLFAKLGGAAPFSPGAVRSLVRLGWAAVATAIAGIVCRMAAHYLISLGSPDGTRSLVLSLSSTDIGTLLVGILALAFALVVAEAQRLDEDARSIV